MIVNLCARADINIGYRSYPYILKRRLCNEAYRGQGIRAGGCWLATVWQKETSKEARWSVV